jgi:uncharacterized DUF497 family protein
MHHTAKMKFEWDPQKYSSNLRKHGIPFEDAVRVFYDERRTTVPDLRHHYGEPRFITTGYVLDRLCVIVYTYRCQETVRMISARKANSREKKRHAREIQARSHQSACHDSRRLGAS